MKNTYDITRSPSNQQLVFASSEQRLAAYLLDMIMIVFLVYTLKATFINYQPPAFFVDIWNNISGDDWYRHRIIRRSTAIFVWIFYCLAMECTPWKATLGKKLMKIQVVDEEGKRMSFLQSLSRNLFKFISFAFASLGFIWIMFNRKRKGWHDSIASTFVVRASN